MKLNKTDVVRQTRAAIKAVNRQAESFCSLPEEALRHRPEPNQWSALDCLDHINLFYADYFPRLEAAVRRASPANQATYTPGYFGQKMVNGLRPNQGQRRMKIKTFRRMNPATDDQPSERIFEALFGYHTQLEKLLTEAEALNWNRVKVNSAIGPLLRFKLGDCFRLLLAHTERHIRQAEEALETRSPAMRT